MYQQSMIMTQWGSIMSIPHIVKGLFFHLVGRVYWWLCQHFSMLLFSWCPWWHCLHLIHWVQVIAVVWGYTQGRSRNGNDAGGESRCESLILLHVGKLNLFLYDRFPSIIVTYTSDSPPVHKSILPRVYRTLCTPDPPTLSRPIRTSSANCDFDCIKL